MHLSSFRAALKSQLRGEKGFQLCGVFFVQHIAVDQEGGEEGGKEG